MTEQPRLGTSASAAALALSILLLVGAVAPAFAAGVATPAANASANDVALGATASGESFGTTGDSLGASGATLGADAPQLGASAHDSTAGPPTNAPEGNATTFSGEILAGANESTLPTDATRTNVTLLTGQTVTVLAEGNRTRYRVSGDDEMRKVTTDDATYVYPVGVDFERFDRHLFDVAFLIEQNLTDAETDSIPIIASGRERARGLSTDDPAADRALDAAEGVSPGATLESIDAAAGAVAKDRAARAYASLAADAAVERVTLDVKYRLEATNNADAVSAPRAWESHGVSGDGVKVAIIDSGIDESHPAIDRVEGPEDFTNEPARGDPRGHGTHVAGIVASDDETHPGVAPDATLLDVRVLTAEGWGFTSWIIDGMEYAVEQDADVISMSLGGTVRSERADDRYTAAVNSAVENGTLVVTSAGNGGERGTISTPGIQSKALTVGASTYGGSIAPRSSHGPTEFGYFVKPDLVAPGRGVTSTAANTGGFVKKSGTSMAAPAVSGAAALVMEKHPDWSPERVRSALTGTADPLVDGDGRTYDVYAQGAGEVDAADALDTDLVATPGTVDFGTLRNGTTRSRTVALTNVGDENLTVEPNATATDIDDGNAESVAVNRSTVSVEPGETTHLRLTVETDLPPGTYSGRLSLGDDYAVVFGFVRLHEVTVEKRAAAGARVDDDPVQLFADEPGREKITGAAGRATLANGSATYHMIGGGTYHVLSEGVDETTGEPVVFSETLRVDDDERVVLDERETVAYDLEVADRDSPGSLATRSVRVAYATRTGSGEEYGGEIVAASPDSPAVRFNRDAGLDATVGRLLVADPAGETAPDAASAVADAASSAGESAVEDESAVEGESAGASKAAAFDAPEAYHLVHEVAGVSGDRTTRVSRADLAEKRLTYYRAARDESYDVAMAASTPDGFEHVVAGGVGDRRTQTVYVNDRVAVHDVRAAGATGDWALDGSATAFHDPGATPAVEVNRHPYVGDLRWEVDGGDLRYYAAAQADGDGHRFAAGTRDRVALRKNDDLAFSHRVSGPGWRDTGESVRSSDELELTVVGRNDATPLSSRTVTTHRATYESGADYDPPAIESVAVRDLTTNNTAGGRLRVRITVSDDAAEVAALVATDADAVPFDSDARGWEEGSVERVESTGGDAVYEATFDVGERWGDHLGPVDLAVAASDARGNTVESTTFDAVRVDAHPPAVGVAALGATSDPAGVPDRPVYTNGSLTMDATTGASPDDAREVSLALSAEFASYRTSAPADSAGGRTWTVTEDLRDLPDDGAYAAEAVARDRFGNANRTPAGRVVLDRAAPELGASLTRLDAETGRVTVVADEPLRAAPEVTVRLPNGTTTDVASTRSGDREWTGTFALADADGAYAATATGADLAGNPGRADSTARVASVAADAGTPATVAVGGSTGAGASPAAAESGAFVRLRTDGPANDAATLTRSRSALAPLAPNLVGVEFLSADLGEELAASLETATVGVPVNDSRLPADTNQNAVRIGRYDAETGDWELLDTEVRNLTVGGTTHAYWVAEVDHRSAGGEGSAAGDADSADDATSSADRAAGASRATYGAVVVDRAAPTLDGESPEGVTYEDASAATVEFAYRDDLSGVDPSAVELYVDGRDVTDDPATTVTSEYARYDASALGYGNYTARVEVADRAGNAAEYPASFGIVADDDPPRLLGVPRVDGIDLRERPELDAGTDSVKLDARFTDDGIGVDADSVRVRFDGEDVTDDATVTSDGDGVAVSYAPKSLVDGRSYRFAVSIEDDEGNRAEHTYQFVVAEPPSGGSGGSGGDGSGDGGAGGSAGGGGGGGAPPPPVQVEVLERGDAHLRAAVTSARADAPGRVAPDGGLVGGDVTFRSVGVTPTSAGPEPRFLLDLDAAASAPAGVADFAGASRTLGYLTATPTYVADDELDAVTVTFDVATATTDAPEGVSLWHSRGGDWERLDAEFVGERAGSYRFRASADATGAYAVGLDEPAFGVPAATLDAAEIPVGDAVEVTATVENAGTLSGTERVALTVDGEPAEATEVTLGPGEETTVSFSRTFETPDEYDLRVGVADADAEAGTLAVTADRAEGGASDAADEARGDGEREDGDSAGGAARTPGFGLLASAVALLAAGLVARLRSRCGDR